MSASPALEYPCDPAPEPGCARPLAAGVHWVRLPVPGSLRHINVWLLEDGDGWTLIDTGMDVPEARAAWDGALRAYLGDRPLRRIICTHHHPDHAGLAAMLARRYGVAVFMSAAEHALLGRLARIWSDPGARQERLADFAREGLEATPANESLLALEGYRRVVSGIPARIEHLVDGDELAIGAERWRAHLVRGHSDGQLVFHNARAGLLIAGDHVLPRITSNIGIYPERADLDPVASYLGSFAVLESLSPEPLVLPSHGNVFRGLKARTAQLRAHHAATLDVLRGMLAPAAHGGSTATELAAQLFPGARDPLNGLLALGETLAHLRRLEGLGAVGSETDAAGARRYRLRAAD
jgi:glyoxylase-like metal-dependent hydrolase (beta-lactamase superfamily II)